jgi:putative phage-type endonuclease
VLVSALSIHEAEWHAQRAKGIGASDVPAIAGVSTYATPIDVWQSKVGLVEPNPETPLTRWGNLLEPVIAEEAERELGVKFRRLARAVHYRDWPILFAHLDRTSAEAILEVKSSMTTKGWGESGSSEVPDHVALQVQAQLACADKELAYVAALIGYRDFRTYRIARDRELFDDLIQPLLREFWTLVETNTPPEPDGSDGYGSFIRRLHPSDGGDERAATPEEQLLGSALANAIAERERAEAHESELKQRLMLAMGTTGKLDGPGWRVTWRQSKDRVTPIGT